MRPTALRRRLSASAADSGTAGRPMAMRRPAIGVGPATAARRSGPRRMRQPGSTARNREEACPAISVVSGAKVCQVGCGMTSSTGRAGCGSASAARARRRPRARRPSPARRRPRARRLGSRLGGSRPRLGRDLGSATTVGGLGARRDSCGLGARRQLVELRLGARRSGSSIASAAATTSGSSSSATGGVACLLRS